MGLPHSKSEWLGHCNIGAIFESALDGNRNCTV
jgi:hypothetical protein